MADHRFQTGELILDRYRVTGLLGAGGVGVVYDTVDDRIGRPVAVKVLRRSAQDHRTAAKRTIREARTLASLSHPHLVTLLDFEYLNDGCPVLVMERVHGESAQALLTREGPLKVAAVVDILRQSLAALSELHAAGIIHRDLKPGNILIDQPEAGRYNVKLIDFGIVQLVTDDGATALTLSGEVFGSPRYMSPEQWTQQPVDARTDLYALGLIAHVLLAGDHFIQVRNPVQIFEAHLQPFRPRLSVTGAGEPVPPILADIIQRAIQPKPEQRFQSAAEMRQAMEPLLSPSGHLIPPSLGWLDQDEETTLAAPPDPDATLLDPGALHKAVMMATGDGFPALGTDPSARLPPAPKTVGDQRLPLAPDDERTGVTRGDFERALRASHGPPQPQAVTLPPLAAPVPRPVSGALPAPAAPTPWPAPRPVPQPAALADRPTVPQGQLEPTDAFRAPALPPPRGFWGRLWRRLFGRPRRRP